MPSSEIKHVKNSQGVQLARLAREQGVLRKLFSEFLKNPTYLDKFFNDIKIFWFIKLQQEAEKIGARLYLIQDVPVDYNVTYDQAFLTAGLGDPGNDFLLEVEGQYVLPKNITKETVILLNFPGGHSNYEKTVDWGVRHKWRKSTPHVLLSLAKELPNLNHVLESDSMYIVETTGVLVKGRLCDCFVCWRDYLRGSNVEWQDTFRDKTHWYVFCVDTLSLS